MTPAFRLDFQSRKTSSSQLYSGDASAAEAHLKDAVTIWERLAHRHPDPERARNEWAKACFRLGAFLFAQNRRADATRRLRQAAALWEGLEGPVRKEFETDYRDRLRRYLENAEADTPGPPQS